ncbi:MAG: hypothetical protein ACYDEY_06995 [Acidimicrobiales bacterium]
MNEADFSFRSETIITPSKFVISLQRTYDNAYASASEIATPAHRTATAAVFRELAMVSEALSAQQLSDARRLSAPGGVALRVFLHATKTTVFREARRGSFMLGMRYSIRPRAAT